MLRILMKQTHVYINANTNMLINKRKGVGLKHYNDSIAFI